MSTAPTNLPASRAALGAHVTRTLHEQAYDRLAERFLALFRASRSHAFPAIWVSLDVATQELAAEGTLPFGESRRLYECASRDLTQMAALLVRGPRSAAQALHRASREQGALLPLLNVLRLSGDAIYRLAGEIGRTELRRAGDVTCAGTLACVECGHVRRAHVTALVTPCPRCTAQGFAKGFGP